MGATRLTFVDQSGAQSPSMGVRYLGHDHPMGIEGVGRGGQGRTSPHPGDRAGGKPGGMSQMRHTPAIDQNACPL